MLGVAISEPVTISAKEMEAPNHRKNWPTVEVLVCRLQNIPPDVIEYFIILIIILVVLK